MTNLNNPTTPDQQSGVSTPSEGEITIKLNSKGKYTWTITVDIPPDDTNENGTSKAINRLIMYDVKLKDALPSHPTGNSNKFTSFQ